MRNRYIFLQIKLFFTLFKSKKLNLKKLLNAFFCFLFYSIKRKRSAKSPLMISIELSNECNLRCMFCRNSDGEIFNLNPKEPDVPIEKGCMPFSMYSQIIDQIKDYALIAVLYTNGEPLIYKDIVRCVEYATERNVATMLATNGTLLSEEKIQQLLDAGLDFVKIQLSGFTQDVYSVQVAGGNVEKVKENIRLLDRIKRQGKYSTAIMVDYISYQYNKHQWPLMQEFCRDLDVILNARPGNPAHGLEDKEPALSTGRLPLKISCDWLWKGMQINFNGDILPCCEAVVWSGTKTYGKIQTQGEKNNLLDIWNGSSAKNWRKTITEKGRGAIGICSLCARKGITFKW